MFRLFSSSLPFIASKYNIDMYLICCVHLFIVLWSFLLILERKGVSKSGLITLINNIYYNIFEQ